MISDNNEIYETEVEALVQKLKFYREFYDSFTVSATAKLPPPSPKMETDKIHRSQMLQFLHKDWPYPKFASIWKGGCAVKRLLKSPPSKPNP